MACHATATVEATRPLCRASLLSSSLWSSMSSIVSAPCWLYKHSSSALLSAAAANSLHVMDDVKISHPYHYGIWFISEHQTHLKCFSAAPQPPQILNAILQLRLHFNDNDDDDILRKYNRKMYFLQATRCYDAKLYSTIQLDVLRSVSIYGAAAATVDNDNNECTGWCRSRSSESLHISTLIWNPRRTIPGDTGAIKHTFRNWLACWIFVHFNRIESKILRISFSSFLRNRFHLD